jgi:hydrogenase nickel incorporation protein HypA/HybF
MHEMSLVEELLAQAECIAAEHRGQIEEVFVSVGPLAGVEPLLLQSAFETLAPTGARLVIDEIALRVRCESCGQEFEPERLILVCPACESGNCKVLAGDALMLQCVTLVRPD